MGHARSHTNQAHTHTWRDKTKGMGRGVREGGEGANGHAQKTNGRSAGGRRGAALPGITEIVFKARNTLNVRRAETLPRCTNSVTYLQDQMHSYYTATHAAQQQQPHHSLQGGRPELRDAPPPGKWTT